MKLTCQSSAGQDFREAFMGFHFNFKLLELQNSTQASG